MNEPYTAGYLKPKGLQGGGRLYEFNGEKMRISDIAALTGIPTNTLRARLLHGLTPEEAFRNVDYRAPEYKKQGFNRQKRYNYHGEALTKREICEREHINMGLLNYRIYTLKFYERIDDD